MKDYKQIHKGPVQATGSGEDPPERIWIGLGSIRSWLPWKEVENDVPYIRADLAERDLAFFKRAFRITLVLACVLVILVAILAGQAGAQEIESVFSQADTTDTYVRIIPKDDIYETKGWIMLNDSTRLHFVIKPLDPLVGPPKPSLWEEHKPFWKAAIGAVGLVILWGLVS